MKIRTLLAAVAALVLCVPMARADQANIDHAMRDAVALYKNGGEPAMREKAKLCYDSIDFGQGNKAQTAATGVEYCYAFETAAIAIMSARNEWKNTGYFNATDLLARAAYYLEQARVVTLPEQFTPYVQKRADYIRARIPTML
jgi:hypothetical protein